MYINILEKALERFTDMEKNWLNILSVYTLVDQENWPANGSVNYNTILQLKLFCRHEGKGNEKLYVNLFFTLQDNYDIYKKCGLMTSESDVRFRGRKREIA